MAAPVLGLALATVIAMQAGADTQIYRLTEKSWARFTATAPTRENGVHGLSHNVQGRIFIPGGRIADAKAEIGIPILSFAAKSGMNQHTYTAVEAARYPMVIFRSKSIQVESVTPEAGAERIKGKVTGILHFHGVQRQLTSDFSALVGPDGVRIDAEFKFLLTDYGVERPRMAIFQVDDPVLITVFLDARKDSLVTQAPGSQ